MQPETLKVMRQAVCALLAKDAWSDAAREAAIKARQHHAAKAQSATSSEERDAHIHAANMHGRSLSKPEAYAAKAQAASAVANAMGRQGPSAMTAAEQQGRMQSGGFPRGKDGGPGSGPRKGGGSAASAYAEKEAHHAAASGHYLVAGMSPSMSETPVAPAIRAKHREASKAHWAAQAAHGTAAYPAAKAAAEQASAKAGDPHVHIEAHNAHLKKKYGRDEAPNALREIVDVLEQLVALRCGANDGGPGSGPHKGGGKQIKPLPKGFGMKAGSPEHLAGRAVAAKEAAERAKAEQAAQAERDAKWRASTASMHEPVHNKYD